MIYASSNNFSSTYPFELWAQFFNFFRTKKWKQTWHVGDVSGNIEDWTGVAWVARLRQCAALNKLSEQLRYKYSIFKFVSHQDVFRHSRTRTVQLNSFRNNLEKYIQCNCIYIYYKLYIRMHVCMLHSMSTDSIRIDMVLHFHGQCSCSDQTRSCIICDQCPAHLQTQSQHLNLIQTLSRLINQPATRLADKSWAADAGAIGSLQNRPDKRLDLWPVEKPNKKTTAIFQNCIKWVCLRTRMEKAWQGS